MSLYEPDFLKDWPLCPLWDTATWTNGLPFRGFDFSASGDPVIKIAELKNGITEQTQFTRQTFAAKYRVYRGDVLYSWSGSPETSLDVFVWSGPEGWLNQHIFKVIVAEGVDRGFHVQLLRYLRPNLVAIATNKQTTGLGHVTQADMRRLFVRVPPLDEQRAIAEVLGALDDRAELNRQMNRTLEDMASALFKSWFVDFDPVVAKAESRQPFGMDAATAALFPTAFVESDLGALPQGWSAATVASCVADVFDGPHATPPEAGSGAVFLGIGNMTGTSLDLSDVRHIAESDWARWTRRVTPREGDIVFTYEAALGRFALVPPGLRCCLGRRMALVRPRRTEDAPFVFHQFVAPPFQEVVVARTWTGSTVDRTPLTEFPDYPFLWPGDALVRAFCRRAEPMWALIHHNQAESSTLTALRDTLLPKLLSGEVRLKQAEKVVEAAL